MFAYLSARRGCAVPEFAYAKRLKALRISIVKQLRRCAFSCPSRRYQPPTREHILNGEPFAQCVPDYITVEKKILQGC